VSRLTLSFKNKVLKVIPVAVGEMVIGSDPQCDIHIDSLAVHARHAAITTEGGNSVLRDLESPEGTFVNDEKITERALEDGDLIQVGKHTLSFAHNAEYDPADADALFDSAKASHPRDGWLQIMSGNNVGKSISLSRKLTNLGKPGVQMAVIARRNDGYFLSHLEGDKPPLVGDEPIGDTAWHLEDGDIIRIGNVKMQFYLE